ncbi:MAG: hypothetical protein H6553_12150 [Chitinophagales bacterium]|nr:hypothetical protein [Chitinophagales bacterium]
MLAININAFSQDFDTKINTTADELAKTIINTGKKKVAIVEFENLDNSQTQLGIFLADEISSSLSNLTANQTKFSVLERANLDQILEEKRILKSFDRSQLAKDLGKIDAADILISATITEFNGLYRLNIKLLDTKTGNSLASYKTSFIQESSLKELQKQIVESSTTVKNKPQQEIKDYNVPKETSAVGDVCFKISSSNYSAVLSIKKIGSNEKIKTIDVLAYQNASCVYNIPSGIYQIEMSWYYYSDYKSSIRRTDTQEIKVISGKENIYELEY